MGLSRSPTFIAGPGFTRREMVALGVDANGRSVNFWQTLKDFWIAYFQLAGATVDNYSILRQVLKSDASDRLSP
jgi:hypothetical protein